MSVQELMDYLVHMNPQAQVVIHRDNNNYGFGLIDKIEIGVFQTTSYGNDFYNAEGILANPSEVEAICIYPQDYDLRNTGPSEEELDDGE